jgi:hypothetical protein
MTCRGHPAEIVATAAVSSDFARDQPFLLTEAWPALGALVPAKSVALHPNPRASAPAVSPGQTLSQQINQARASGDTDKLLALIAQAPGDARDRIVQQQAWNFASNVFRC